MLYICFAKKLQHGQKYRNKINRTDDFQTIVDLIEGINLAGLIKKHNSDHYYMAFKSRTHLIPMLFGMLSRCDSMTEICEGLRAMGGKLNHQGLDQSPAKSTACDGLRNRDSKFFEDVYFSMVSRYKTFLSALLLALRWHRC